mgnify:CR=1 FL=1
MKRTLLLLVVLLCGIVRVCAQESLEAGTYYIQNVEQGGFLSSGASWGTRAVLSPHGVDFKVTLSNGSYTLTTQIQGVSKALRPSDGYMDQSGTWTVEPLSDGTYALFNGTNYFGYVADNTHPWVPRLDTYTDTNSLSSHWRFWTREQLEATLEEASAGEPVDATFFIQAPDMLIGDYRVTGTKVWGNDLTATGGITDGGSYVRNNANGEKFNTAAYNISQRLEGIPNGVYSLSVQGYYRNGSNSVASAAHNNETEELLPYLYAGNKQASLPSVFSCARSSSSGGWATSTAAGYVPNSQSDAANCFDSDESVYLTTIRDIVVVDGTLTIGIAKENKTVANDWMCFDNFTLLYYGSDIGSLREAALKEIDTYASKNTTEDDDYATTIATQRAAVENAGTENEITDALEQVRKAYDIYVSKPEPTDTPIDLSELIENASLSEGTNWWTTMLDNNPGYNQVWASLTTGGVPVVEAYAGYSEHELKAFSMLQSVTLSPGMYRLKGYAFYRYGTSYNSDITGTGEEISLAYLVAGEHRQKVMRLGDITASTYANTMEEAATAFSDGNYLNSLIFELDDATTIDIGYEGIHDRYRSWFIAGPVALEKINSDILAREADDEFAAEKILYSVRWDGYKTISNQALDHSDFDAVVEQAKASLPSLTTQGELDAKDAEVWNALCNLLKTGITVSGQFDITTLIVNPAFNTNYDGWTFGHGPTWDATGVVESFNHAAEDFNQTLKSMPSGSYTLKVQAFYRDVYYAFSAQPYEQGQTDVPAELYLGVHSIKIKNIHDDARVRSARPSSDVPGAFNKSVPNTLNGAHDAFKAGLYWNILRTDISEDGDLTLGLRFQGGQAENWMAFDNFRLYYGGKTVPVKLEQLEKFPLDEDMYADVSTDIFLRAGKTHGLCLPFDTDASQFESVWTLGHVDYDSESKTLSGTLVPVHELKAGVGYFVRVREDMTISGKDVLLRSVQPDSIPLLWEGGALSGYYGKTTLTRKFRMSEEEDNLEYLTVKTNQPGYKAMVLLPTNILNRAKVITLSEADFSNMDITVNLENIQARAFLAEAKYVNSSSTSVVANYNACPPGRRDQPHNVVVPVPLSDVVQTLTYQVAGEDGITTIEIPAGTDFVEIPNLVPQEDYTYVIKDSDKEVSKGTVHTEGSLRMIKVSSVSNVRDLGGWPTTDGNTVNYGLIYRGGELNGGHVMSDADREELRRLGIMAEVDLREDSDISGFTGTTYGLGSDAQYIYLNSHEFGDDALQDYKEMYKTIFNFILDNLRNDRSVYFHCIWGADRTGALAFLLEGLIGLGYDALYKDYELTSYSIAGSRKKSGLDTKFDYIRALSGNGLQQKFLTYWRDEVGIPAEDLCEFIVRMTNGEPSIVTAINCVGSDTLGVQDADCQYFSIDGRHQAHLQKGVNIIRTKDGTSRKVVVR